MAEADTLLPKRTLDGVDILGSSTDVGDSDAGAGNVSNGSRGSITTSKPKVLVLDARGDSALEVLARSWCAKVGEHALVGRVGRTCLACCVREARGLGVRVVVRV